MNRFSPLALLASLMLVVSSHAATTDPMGGMVIPIKGESDTRISIPFSRAVEFEGRVDSISGSTITVVGSPAWADGQFVYGDADSSDAANTYYAVFITGEKEGLALEITANTADSFTVDLGSEDLAGVLSDSVDGADAGDLIQIAPFWTPASLFAGVTLPDQAKIAVYDNSAFGVNKSPSLYTYYDGFGWYDGSFNLSDDSLLYNAESILVRLPSGSSDVDLVISGAVPMFKARWVFETGDTNEGNDYSISVYSPVDVTLADSGLGFADGVKVAFYDNAVSGVNKSPNLYTYYEGYGWFDGSFNSADTFSLPAGTSFVLRKPGTSEVDEVTWSFLPTYLQ